MNFGFECLDRWSLLLFYCIHLDLESCEQIGHQVYLSVSFSLQGSVKFLRSDCKIWLKCLYPILKGVDFFPQQLNSFL